MPINLTNLKIKPILKEKSVFEKNEKYSYMKAFGRPDTIVLDSYGEYSILSFVNLFPNSKDVKYDVKYSPYIRKYRIINHLAVAPDAYRMEKPLIYAIVRNGNRYRFEKLFRINNPDFLAIILLVIESTYKHCEEMTAIVMDCSEEDAIKDYVSQIKWGVIVDLVNKTAMLIDRESAAVQFHKRFRLIKHTFLK